MSSGGGVDDSTSSPMAADVPSSSLASNEATGSVPQSQNTMNSNDASYSTTATEQNNTPGAGVGFAPMQGVGYVTQGTPVMMQPEQINGGSVSVMPFLATPQMVSVPHPAGMFPSMVSPSVNDGGMVTPVIPVVQSPYINGPPGAMVGVGGPPMPMYAVPNGMPGKIGYTAWPPGQPGTGSAPPSVQFMAYPPPHGLSGQPPPPMFAMHHMQQPKGGVSGRGRGHHHRHHNQHNTHQQRKNDGVEYSRTNVYISGLPPTTSDDDLRVLCENHGAIVSAKAIIDRELKQCKGYGFVMFEQEASAKVAVNALVRSGIQAAFAKVSKSSTTQPKQEVDPTNLYITNLPKDHDETALSAMLHEAMGPFAGEVVSCRILRDDYGVSRGVGLARMDSHDACDKIISRLNGLVLPVGGEALRVKYANGPSPRKFNSHATSAAHASPKHAGARGGAQAAAASVAADLAALHLGTGTPPPPAAVVVAPPPVVTPVLPPAAVIAPPGGVGPVEVVQPGDDMAYLWMRDTPRVHQAPLPADGVVVSVAAADAGNGGDGQDTAPPRADSAADNTSPTPLPPVQLTTSGGSGIFVEIPMSAMASAQANARAKAQMLFQPVGDSERQQSQYVRYLQNQNQMM